MSEEESIIFDKFMAEKDEKRKEELYTELRRLRKIREEKEKTRRKIKKTTAKGK